MNTKDTLSILDNIHEHYSNSFNYRDIHAVAILPDGRIAAGASNYKIYILNPNTPTQNWQFDIEIDNQSLCSCLCLLKDGKLIANSYHIAIYSINENSYTEVFTIEIHNSGYIYKVITLPGNRFAYSADDGFIRIAKDEEPYSAKPIALLGPNKESIECLVYLKESDLLISLSKDDVLYVWNATTYKLIKTIEGVECAGNNCMCEIDGERVIVGGNKKFNIVNVKEGKIEKTIENRRFGDVYSVMKLRGENCFVLGGDAGQLIVYDQVSQQYKMVQITAASITDIKRIDDETFVTCSKPGYVKVWKY